MTEPTRTIVYIHSGNFGVDAEYALAREFATQMERQDVRVIQIGDGQNILTYDELQAGLAQVEGPYNVIISSHGLIDDQGNYRIQIDPPGYQSPRGMEYYRDLADRALALGAPQSLVDAFLDDDQTALEEIEKTYFPTIIRDTQMNGRQLLEALPPGVQSIMLNTCFAEAIAKDTAVLPEGIPVFSASTDELPASASSIEEALYRTMQGPADQREVQDFYLQYMLNGFNAVQEQFRYNTVMGHDMRAPVEYLDIMPTSIAVSQGRSIDLAEPLRQQTPMDISPAAVDRITQMLLDARRDDRVANRQVTPDEIRAQVQVAAEQLIQGSPVTNRISGVGGMRDYHSPQMPDMIHSISEPQLAIALMVAELDIRANAQGIDLVKAYDQLVQPASSPAIEAPAAELAAANPLRDALAGFTASPELAAMNLNGGQHFAKGTNVTPGGVGAGVGEIALG